MKRTGVATFMFVGEKPSRTALDRGWSWKDGRLAAKQLFDALKAIGIDPAEQRFDNVFQADLSKPERVCRNAMRRIDRAARSGTVIVALGRKAAAELTQRNVPHVQVTHPAARGAIRKKERYAAAIRGALAERLLEGKGPW